MSKFKFDDINLSKALAESILDGLEGVLPQEEACKPYQVISGSGDGWFYDPTEGKMVCVSRGTEIVSVSEEVDDYGRMLVRCPTRFLLLPENEIVSIGFN
jgi:hypothetical protein|tara:strand:- start:991 stop:1290 length:300 start_codon:yes stop_codon:yes gene_type:complete